MTELFDDLAELIREKRLRDLRISLGELSTGDTVDFLERLGVKDRAVAFRLLPKDTAVDVFDMLDQSLQHEDRRRTQRRRRRPLLRITGP